MRVETKLSVFANGQFSGQLTFVNKLCFPQPKSNFTFFHMFFLPKISIFFCKNSRFFAKTSYFLDKTVIIVTTNYINVCVDVLDKLSKFATFTQSFVQNSQKSEFFSKKKIENFSKKTCEKK